MEPNDTCSSASPPRAVNDTSHHVVAALRTLRLCPGVSVSLVTAMADNVVGAPGVDPGPAAARLAQTSQPAAVVAASWRRWQSFWNRSAISLPTAPLVEDYWYGAQANTAAMTPSARLVMQTQSNGGRNAPPPGLYGPWVTTDHPSWNVNTRQGLRHDFIRRTPPRVLRVVMPVTCAPHRVCSES